jgi:hypothetical protein
MMNDMMNVMGAMHWGMGLIGLLILPKSLSHLV